MDGDQQLNFYYLYPAAIMDRFIGQQNSAQVCWQDIHELEIRESGIKAENQAEIKGVNQVGIKASYFRKSSS